MTEGVTKQQLRDACRAVRAGLAPDIKKERDTAICRQIAQLTEFRRAGQVLLYAPLPGEINLLPLAKLCLRKGKTVAFPVTDPVTGRLTFRALRRGDRLAPGAYGVPEPPADAPVCLPDKKTLCVLPGLCFDRCGNRLGQGKGCYDRFLSSFPGVTVGAVWEELLFAEIPTEAHDLPVAVLVTEQTLLRTGVKRDRRTSIPAAGLLRGAKTVGHRLARCADRLRLTEYADRGVKKLREQADRLWSRLFRKDASAQKSETAEESGRMQHRGILSTALHAPPTLVAVTFVLVRLSRLVQDRLSRRGSEYIGVILLQILILLIPAMVYIRLRDLRFQKRTHIRRLLPQQLWFLFCVWILMTTGSLLISILTGGISSLTGNFTLYNTFLARSGGSAWETLYLLLAFGVLPAFCEELVYRLVLCTEYERVGTGTAVIVSALFFAMLHFSVRLFPVYLWLGLLLAGAMYATRSVLAPMLLHLTYNVFCLFGQPYLSAFYINAGSGELFIFCLMVLFLLFAAFAAGEARKTFHRYARNEDSGLEQIPTVREAAGRTVGALASPAAALCLILWIIFS